MRSSRSAAVGVLVVLTIALAVTGFAFRFHLAGLALLGAAVPAAVCAWLVLGAPVRRSDIGR